MTRHQEYENEPDRGYFYSNYGGGPYPEIATRTETDIRRDLEARLSSNSKVDLKKINFEVEAGIVTMSGEVEHLEEKRAAGNDACEIPGVWDVRNDIKVKRPEQ